MAGFFFCVRYPCVCSTDQHYQSDRSPRRFALWLDHFYHWPMRQIELPLPSTQRSRPRPQSPHDLQGQRQDCYRIAARPGGNATGFATAHEEAYARKSLEFLKEILPSASRVAVLYNPTNPFNVNFYHQVQHTAIALAVRIDAIDARNIEELDTVITALSAKPPDALLVTTDPFLAGRVHEIVTATIQQKLPALFGFREYPQAGGLMSYGANLADMYRRVATYVDRILKGAKPADLPIQLPTTFELVINLKTAKALGLNVPTTLLVRADEVIE